MRRPVAVLPVPALLLSALLAGCGVEAEELQPSRPAPDAVLVQHGPVTLAYPPAYAATGSTAGDEGEPDSWSAGAVREDGSFASSVLVELQADVPSRDHVERVAAEIEEDGDAVSEVRPFRWESDAEGYYFRARTAPPAGSIDDTPYDALYVVLRADDETVRIIGTARDADERGQLDQVLGSLRVGTDPDAVAELGPRYGS